ncbi:hypothetical protein [Pseudanabaena sp. UWO310]|uniref:hypothetical protein n=1 Tax=Pseudanabaena sp. UWO310 TaxID=2480795 RepID=UPI001CC2006B|nr:hypothetical protein [Pseudanabaena sp. UWO310]
MSKSYISTKLRKLVSDRAQNCCEYCLIPESLTLVSHQVDHVIAELLDFIILDKTNGEKILKSKNLVA